LETRDGILKFDILESIWDGLKLSRGKMIHGITTGGNANRDNTGVAIDIGHNRLSNLG